ncbi:MAG: flagellar hook-basal body complex protein FliE [Acetobacteraceae bacterium]
MASNGVVSTGFADLLGSAAKSALQSVRNAEGVTAQGLAGKADTQAVVEALSNAELTMQTVVAVRDRILGAYNDVMRMNI